LRGTLSLNQSPLIGLNARVDFWQALWRDTGLKREQAELWAAAADGLVSLPLLDRVPFRREALIAAAMRRMDDRIAGRAIPSTPSETVLPEIVEAPAVPRGKRQIIEAATRLIGREGVDRLTHRKIAAEAGLSLAATTYFYESKDDLIADAFREIQRQAVYAVVQGETQPGHFASTIMLDEQNEERWQLAAMLALNQAAIRYARFDDLALTLRQLRGIDAMRWLRAHGCADADHLDGILWSGVTTSISEYALCLPASERRRHLDRETARAFGLLFGAR
jgi:AcrR family transcriptional regulator